MIRNKKSAPAPTSPRPGIEKPKNTAGLSNINPFSENKSKQEKIEIQNMKAKRQNALFNLLVIFFDHRKLSKLFAGVDVTYFEW